jgi:hypothetical protein
VVAICQNAPAVLTSTATQSPDVVAAPPTRVAGEPTHESSRVWLPLSWLRCAALAAYQRAQAGSDAAVTNAEARRRAGQRARQQQQHGTHRRPAGQTSRYGGVGRGQRYPSNGRAVRQRSERYDAPGRYRAAAAAGGRGRGGVGEGGGRVLARRLSRGGRHLPERSSGFDIHRDSITRRWGLADDEWGIQQPHEDEDEELMMAASYGRGYGLGTEHHHGHRHGRRGEEVSWAFPSWNRSILTEIYLCHARSLSRI